MDGWGDEPIFNSSNTNWSQNNSNSNNGWLLFLLYCYF